METKITLVLDAQKYHAELDKVIQSARTSAASIASAAAGAGQSAAGLGKQMVGTGEKIKNITIPAKGMFASLKSGFAAFRDELKNGDSVAKTLASHVKGIFSPVGILITGFTAVGALAVTCWNKMTLSAEAYAGKLAKATEEAKKKREETEKRIQKTKEYLSSLEQLSSAENRDNASMAQAQVLVAALTQKYGD